MITISFIITILIVAIFYSGSSVGYTAGSSVKEDELFKSCIKNGPQLHIHRKGYETYFIKMERISEDDVEERETGMGSHYVLKKDKNK